ncbi:serine protein kinase RIO, partial [Candidatus Woesearchaeota archaeon CG11_big_fil_rev_8_21_14_0_20_43_8]
MAKAKEKFKTYGDVFDNFTNRVLFKLMSQEHFEEDTLSPISIGKEANVFSAKTKDGEFVVVKIYRLETCDFTRMFEYI